MIWRLSHRCDRMARPLADRHYNRQSPGHPNIAPPGACLVLLTETRDAYWITSAPLAEYVKHDWPGAWVCSAFRNEGAGLSSEMVRSAVAATRAVLGEAPPRGFVTFVDPEQTRRKRDPGRCFVRAGFFRTGRTKGGLVALRMASPPRAGEHGCHTMPDAEAPHGWHPQPSIFAAGGLEP